MDLQHKRGQRLSVVAILINMLLALIKLLTGIVGNSYALVADSVESMVDIVAAAVVWQGMNVASQPADEKHPYGHGRAETVSGLIVALIVLGAGFGIAIQAVREIIEPSSSPSAFTLWVLFLVIVVKEGMFRVFNRTGLELESVAVTNDAWHHRSDAITSAAAAIGIAIAVFGGQKYAVADDWAALVASGIILFNGIRLTFAPISDMMDTQHDHVVEEASEVAARVERVEAVEKVFARKSGLRYLVDMHIEVDPRMSVADAHAIAHEAKAAIQRDMPRVLDVLIHVEPHWSQDQSDNQTADMEA